MRRSGIAATVVLLACGARTNLGGVDHRASNGEDAGADARGPDGGPPPRPCQLTAPTRLFSGGKEIQFVALDDTTVYWSDFALGTIGAVPKAGGSARVVAGPGGSPSGLTVADGTVYWTEFAADTVASAPASGEGAVTNLATHQDGAYDVTASGGVLYWTNFRGCTVASLAGGASAQLDHAKQPFTSIVSTDSLVFWISFERKSIERYEIASHARSTLVHGGAYPPSAIATDGARVYFGAASPTDVTIGAVPAAGGEPTTLYTAPCQPDGGVVGECLASLATDGASVYFTAASVVRKIPVGGGTPVAVADQQARPFSIAVDQSCVYWSDLADGSVWAAPK